jgi:hypothetical protein
MAIQSSTIGDNFNNVFSFEQAKSLRRAVRPESVGVINDCRDLVLKRIIVSLSKAFDTMEDDLFDLAEKSLDRDSQNLYLDARSQAREKRGAIEAAFKKQFVNFFEKKVAGDDAQKKPAAGFNALELSLVDDNVFEEKLAVDDLAKRLSANCDEELRALSQRMGFLLSEPELADNANPMSPDTIIKALQSACEQMTAGYQAKMTVMRIVEQHMAHDMLSMYRDVNSHLVAQQILPQIRPTYRKVPQNAAHKPGVAATNAAANNAPPAAPQTEVNSTNDVFATLQQLMAGNQGAGYVPAHGMPNGTLAASQHGLAGVAGSHTGASSTASASQGLLAALNQMQHQIAGSANPSVALANMRNFVPGVTTMADMNLLRELKTRGLGTDSSQIEAMTIDIVAMLFDYVFDDRDIPDNIKALIARLQIPVLKVAILDKSFFSKKSHPARRLLDTLAEASVCFAGQASKSDPLYREIAATVNRVHDEFETDIQLIADALAAFENFLKEREKAAEELIEQSARAMHEREKSEMARLIANDEAERRASLSDLPVPVAAMLRGPWARVLARVYMREGGRGESFQSMIECADDLIWSVEPKFDATQRKQLVGMLPALLKRLQAGLELAEIDSLETKEFFSALVDCHAAAMKAGLRGESVQTLLNGSPTTMQATPLFVKLVAEEKLREDEFKRARRTGVARIQFTDRGVEIEEINARQPQSVGVTPAADVVATASNSSNVAADVSGDDEPADAVSAEVSNLKRGAWVEFVQAGGEKIRAKLSWISPLKGVFLFTSPGVNEALSVSPDALQRQLRLGEARLIEESSLIDRAVGRMVNSFAGATA